VPPSPAALTCFPQGLNRLRKTRRATSAAQEDASPESEHPKKRTVGSPRTSFSAPCKAPHSRLAGGTADSGALPKSDREMWRGLKFPNSLRRMRGSPHPVQPWKELLSEFYSESGGSAEWLPRLRARILRISSMRCAKSFSRPSCVGW
jgi:hypothetical protein